MQLRHVTAVVAALALGATSLAIARGSPGGSFAGESLAAGVVLVGVGWALIACGLRRGLLVAAGVAWFLVEFNNPGVGSPVAFTLGLVTYAACPAIVAHAAFARPPRPLLALAYVSTIGLLGLLPALVFDPAAQGCSGCPRNLLALGSEPGLVTALQRAGLVLGLVWTFAFVALAVWRIARASPPARRVTAPVVLPAAAYLSLVAAGYAHSVGRGFLSNDSVDRALWLAQAAALVALVLCVVAIWARGRRTRTVLARLVVAPDRLRDALARALDDPALGLAYPLADGRLVDAEGHSVELPAGRALTPLVRGGRTVAVLAHRVELRDDPGLLEDVGAAAGLALDHERLQAEARAQLVALRASRARTVEAGDAERRRLERDLHDGAQQRLVVLSFALRLLRAELGGEAAARVDAADAELRDALRELRELARGIYPAVLVDEGLATALEALAEAGGVPIAIEAVPDERLAPAVEAAAYFLAAEAIRHGLGSGVTIRADHADGRLVVEIEGAGVLDLVELEDRIGALDGELTVGQATIRAEVPCGS